MFRAQFDALCDAVLVSQEGLAAWFRGWFYWLNSDALAQCQAELLYTQECSAELQAELLYTQKRAAELQSTPFDWGYVVILCAICITAVLGERVTLAIRNRQKVPVRVVMVPMATGPSQHRPGDCPVCQDSYEELVANGRRLMCLECGHVCCTSCLQQLMAAAPQPLCPLCAERMTPARHRLLFL